MKYCCEVWDSCTVDESNRLERIQIEAGPRIVTGLTSYASVDSIYAETGWEKLSDRRERRKTVLFYNIVNQNVPAYLSDLLPRMVGQRNNYNMRNANDFTIPYCRLRLFQTSFIPASIRLWNNLEADVRESRNPNQFKRRLKELYSVQLKPPAYFSTGTRLASILHTRLRRRCSSLKSDLFRCNLIDTCHCTCGNYIESTEHFFMHCRLYTLHRARLLNGINAIGLTFSIENILFGNPDISYEDNCTLFSIVHRYMYILATGRFV